MRWLITGHMIPGGAFIMRKFFVILFATFVPCAFGQEWKQFDMLNKRLMVSMPAESHIEASTRTLVTDPEATPSEAWVDYKEGDNQLFTRANELFKFTGKDFDDDTSAALKEMSDKKGRFSVTRIPGKITWGMIDKPGLDNSLILYGVAFVHHTDNSVLQIQVYFSPGFIKTPARCTEMTSKILTSLAPGERRLNLDGGAKSLDLFSENMRMTLSLPRNWIYTIKEGFDFKVHYFNEISDFKHPGEGFGIYVGGWPSYFHERIDKGSLIKNTREARLFGEQQKWVEYSNKNETGKNIEIITPVPDKESNMVLHLFASAEDDKGIEAILKILETARIEKKPGRK